MRKWPALLSRSTQPLSAGVVFRLLPLAFLFAAVFTLLINRVWNPHQIYPDIAAGSLPYQNLNKSKELTLLVLFLLGSVVCYYVLLRLIERAVRSVGGEARWLYPLLDVPLACLAYWAGF